MVSLVVAIVTVVALYVVLGTRALQGEQTVTATCEDFLARPTESWVSLRRCALDMDSLVLESEAGDFETLDHRHKGLSSKPYASPPKWVRAWAPVGAEDGRRSVARLAWRVDSADLLRWVNAFDRADERGKQRMWDDPVLLRRMARPALLEGRADRASAEFVLNAFGTTAVPSLLLLTPGTPPKQSLAGPLVGAGLVLVIAFVALRLTRKPELSATAEAELANVNLSGVEVELGALEQLRKEERAARKGRPPRDG